MLRFKLIFFVACFFLPSVAFALSVGEGSLSFSAGLTNFNSGHFDRMRAPNAYESITSGRIMSYDPTVVLDSSFDPIQDDSVDGWNQIPTSYSIAYGNMSASSFSDLGQDDSGQVSSFLPEAESSINISTFGFSSSEVHVGAFHNYYADLVAKDSGSFTFYIDYSGSWAGTTSSTNDTLKLHGGVNISVSEIYLDESGTIAQYRTGDYIANDSISKDIFLRDIDSGSIDIDDFTGLMSLHVNYEIGDMLSLKISTSNYGYAYSEDILTNPVPEPSTFLLLGSGLLGLGWYGRKRKKA